MKVLSGALGGAGFSGTKTSKGKLDPSEGIEFLTPSRSKQGSKQSSGRSSVLEEEGFYGAPGVVAEVRSIGPRSSFREQLVENSDEMSESDVNSNLSIDGSPRRTLVRHKDITLSKAEHVKSEVEKTAEFAKEGDSDEELTHRRTLGRHTDITLSKAEQLKPQVEEMVETAQEGTADGDLDVRQTERTRDLAQEKAEQLEASLRNVLVHPSSLSNGFSEFRRQSLEPPRRQSEGPEPPRRRTFGPP